MDYSEPAPGLFEQIECGLAVAGLMGEDSEEVEGIGVSRVHGEDLAVDGFGVGEAPGLVVLDGELQSLRDGHVGGPRRVEWRTRSARSCDRPAPRGGRSAGRR